VTNHKLVAQALRPARPRNAGLKACATLTLLVLALAPGSAARQATPRAPHIVFVTGDDEYRSEITMPMIAAILEKTHGFRTSIVYARPKPQTKDNIEGLEVLDSADLLVMFTRFRALPEGQLQHILRYVESGKPIVGLRTSTHAFLYPDGHPRQAMNDGFGLDVFGQKWVTHHGSQSSTDVAVHATSAAHPILRGVAPFHARSWLYHVAPLNGEATVLLDGTSINSNKAAKVAEFPLTQPVAWTRQYKASRVFFTTLGHPEDFAQESMRRLVVNGIYWALGRDVPKGGAEATVVGTYDPPPTFDLSKVQ
jgi:type 1 glutamine amidotransferase